jgi:hypothetical protein
VRRQRIELARQDRYDRRTLRHGRTVRPARRGPSAALLAAGAEHHASGAQRQHTTTHERAGKIRRHADAADCVKWRHGGIIGSGALTEGLRRRAD